uniref:flagellar basal body-associated FliL family protein n=1 Tax=Yoonia sp. TaxID=2212373 RepID=UPI0040477F76|tara:strand:+ start:51437 stop:51955 length:519 start_codon:yes stop_codon:yes gene_type:complete
MKKIFLPLILLLIGVGGGVGAGLFLLPNEPASDKNDVAVACAEPASPDHIPKTDIAVVDSNGDPIINEFAKLNNQFIVPIVEDGIVSAMVVMALSIEVAPGNKESVFLAEPKLRDAFLQAMFDHANIGGFSGNFTSAQNLRPLREDLMRRAKQIIPGIAKDVLIMDIVRQDV